MLNADCVSLLSRYAETDRDKAAVRRDFSVLHELILTAFTEMQVELKA